MSSYECPVCHFYSCRCSLDRLERHHDRNRFDMGWDQERDMRRRIEDLRYEERRAEERREEERQRELEEQRRAAQLAYERRQEEEAYWEAHEAEMEGQELELEEEVNDEISEG